MLLVSNENKSHYVYVKDFNRFMFSKTKNRNKKDFCKCCLQCVSNEQVLIEHRENCLMINGKQRVKVKSGSISFKSYFKQLPVPFKIYAGFECILKKVECNSIECNFIGRDSNSSDTEKYQSHIPCSFTYKVVCIDNRFSKKLSFTEEKMLFINSLHQFLVSIIIAGE